MGHTSRCVPIIRYLERLGHTVILTGNERQEAYWKAIFPHLLTLPLQGYNVRYGRRGARTATLLQLPKISKAIKAENKWLSRVVSEQKIDGIISDNRYGLHHAGIRAVIITHQPGVISGFGKIADACLRKIHYKMLGKFGEIWIPDLAGSENLAGGLSHPKKIPAAAKYIGLLSAMRAEEAEDGKRDILVLLSGPEPQRTMLSDLLWNALSSKEFRRHKIAFVEGKKDAVARRGSFENIVWRGFISGDDLQHAMADARLVICRSGYSTLMDLVQLQKRALLIPTPGQTEQEYLAEYSIGKGYFKVASGNQRTLHQEVEEALAFDNKMLLPSSAVNTFSRVVDDWLNRL